MAIVEDDTELQSILAEELSLRGCEVVGLGSAEELCRHMSVHTLDIVAVDLGLSGLPLVFSAAGAEVFDCGGHATYRASFRSCIAPFSR